MTLPGWLRGAGFGLYALLVALAWAQLATQGELDAWPVVGGVAVLVLGAAADMLAPALLAAVPMVAMPVAVVPLTDVDTSNIGWFVLVVFCGIMALRVPFVTGLLGWLAAVLVVAVLAVVSPDPGWPNWIVGTSVIFWICWAARHRIELMERLHRAEAAASAADVVAERQRLAGDLHDIVAHTMAVTVLHLGGARLALAHEPAEAEAGIAEAERLARRSMTELRRLVRVLAEDDAGLGSAVTTPQPTATDLPTLLAEYRSAGLELSTRVAGDLRSVSETTGLVLYRLVQEALANAGRHAPDQPVDVEVTVAAGGAVAATIVNQCSSRKPPQADGLGLRAMVDRVRMVGGQVSAGHEEVERWVVRAKLPG